MGPEQASVGGTSRGGGLVGLTPQRNTFAQRDKAPSSVIEGRESEIERELSKLHTFIEHLYMAVGHFVEKAKPIMRQGSDAIAKETPQEICNTKIGSSISDANTKIFRLMTEIQNSASLIEL